LNCDKAAESLLSAKDDFSSDMTTCARMGGADILNHTLSLPCFRLYESLISSQVRYARQHVRQITYNQVHELDLRLQLMENGFQPTESADMYNQHHTK
jgi:hypothetical protein